ncbi:FAD dependent oxidoreductase [Gonapodya prolifera JEL478]|uniref:FAD dependent oxidoreductase n=1 Tax=Gonapodya prolifera (strain JEL478) TaxID=1344416 RepID=A0A139AAQ8_GONPJ|nr:FAD dependent oxidoreductase [Gonapodya prolifera JEL478]|eukprot:KXS13473.1 FAD dependent oxidoreductase [Gonapodya prolifera JEL478]
MTIHEQFDALIIGAGFAGLYQSHLLHNKLGYKTRAFEASDEPGGTWNWNRYPGARVDICSREYSFKFDKALYNEWNWTEEFAPQPELMNYVRHLVSRYNLAPLLQFNSRVSSCTWDESTKKWTILVHRKTDDGKVEEEEWQGRYLVLATGCLSSPNKPSFAGLDDYIDSGGKVYYTQTWPREGVDFKGKRVAVIGTGSSGVQSIPVIAESAAQLTVFQRTPAYTVPARNHLVRPEEIEDARRNMEDLYRRELDSPLTNGLATPIEKFMKEYGTDDQIEARFEELWSKGGLNFYVSFPDLLITPETSDRAKAFIHKKIKEIVKDPATSSALCPDYPPGCKRICADTNYWATYNLPHVQLVAGLKERPLRSVGGREKMITLEDGSQYGPFDAIVCATGFDAMTGALDKIHIKGRNGITLKDAWSAGPVNYLGLLIHGFPNMFHIAGPGSPSVLTNMIIAIEQHVEWIADTIVALDKAGDTTIEATEEAQNQWVGFVNAVADATLMKGCNSWYLGANVPGKPRVFMPLLGFPDYRKKCFEVQEKGFEGCVLGK